MTGTRMDRRSTMHVPQEARGYWLSVLQAWATPMLGYATLTQPARLNDRPAIRCASCGLQRSSRSAVRRLGWLHQAQHQCQFQSRVMQYRRANVADVTYFITAKDTASLAMVNVGLDETQPNLRG